VFWDNSRLSVDALARLVRRELVLLILLAAITSGVFALTRAAAGATRRLRLADAAAWYERGLSELNAGRLDDALDALRRAASMKPDDHVYQLALARGLEAHGDIAGARLVLLDVLERAPEDPETNLRLARIDVKAGDVAAAVRRYAHALSSMWTADQAEARHSVRLELIRYLLSDGRRSRALSELLVLIPTVPDTAPDRIDAGRLLLEAGDPGRAADQFARALELKPNDPAALAGAGEAAFERGDYAAARRLLARVPQPPARIEELRTIADLVFTADPLAARLALAERRRRLGAAAEHARARLDACGATLAGSDLPELRVRVEALIEALGSRRPPGREALEDGFDLVSGIVRATAVRCGEPGAFDRALLLIAQRHELAGT
jgi:tetratricopeptide (TPR) repeat protein